MIVIDYSQIAISSLMVDLKGHTDAEISIPLVRHMILNTIRAFKVKFQGEFGQVVIACDNRKYWRRELFPHYKAGRKKDRTSSGFDWDGIYQALNQVKSELAEFFPYPVIEVETAEADDVIAVLAEWSQTHELVADGLLGDEAPAPFLILSGDHDFIQLQRYSNVKQYSPIQKKWVRLQGSADEIVLEHAIRGDKGDGIPNFLSADDSFVAGTRQSSIREKDVVNWRTLSMDDWKQTPHYNKIMRNLALVDLRLIPENIREGCISSYLTQKNLRDKSELLNYFIKNKMRNLMETLGDF